MKAIQLILLLNDNYYILLFLNYINLIKYNGYVHKFQIIYSKLLFSASTPNIATTRLASIINVALIR